MSWIHTIIEDVRNHLIPRGPQIDTACSQRNRRKIRLRLRHGARQRPSVDKLVQRPLLRLQPFRRKIRGVKETPDYPLLLAGRRRRCFRCCCFVLQVAVRLAFSSGGGSVDGKQRRTNRLVRLLAALNLDRLNLPWYFNKIFTNKRAITRKIYYAIILLITLYFVF